MEPKHIYFNLIKINDLIELKIMIDNHFYPHIYSFDLIKFILKSDQDFDLMETFSNKTNKFEI